MTPVCNKLKEKQYPNQNKYENKWFYPSLPFSTEYQNNDIKMLDDGFTTAILLIYLFTNVWKFDLNILTEHHTHKLYEENLSIT